MASTPQEQTVQAPPPLAVDLVPDKPHTLAVPPDVRMPRAIRTSGGTARVCGLSGTRSTASGGGAWTVCSCGVDAIPGSGTPAQIGRAAWRGRGEVSVGAA